MTTDDIPDAGVVVPVTGPHPPYLLLVWWRERCATIQRYEIIAWRQFRNRPSEPITAGGPIIEDAYQARDQALIGEDDPYDMLIEDAEGDIHLRPAGPDSPVYGGADEALFVLYERRFGTIEGGRS